MPNSLDSTGLTLATQAELVAAYTAVFQQIYGSDINLSSSTPDGQMMNIFIQSVLDLQDLLQTIYSMFDPDQAVGTVLDQRVAINGIQRQAGTYTVTNVTLTISQSVNLYGLDQSPQPVYTVADNAGNEWQLEVTQTGLGAGSHVLAFRAANVGAVLTIPNTITVPVTIVLGVTAINNPTTYTTLGTNEESDAALRVRRQQSVSLPSQGYLAGLVAALESVSGVTSAFVYENTTGSTNGDGVPGHSIWAIVAGTGASADIANAIYTKRNAGCGMYGSTSYSITQVDGSTFLVYWDAVVQQELFITFTATSIDGVNQPNLAAIRSGLATSLAPAVYGTVNVNELASLVQAIDSNTLVTGAGFSAGTSQVITLSGVAASGAFVFKYNGASSASVNWNDAVGTIQTKLQAVTGLSTATVTGSIATQTLTISLTGISVQGLITLGSNTLQTGGSAAITPSYNESYTNTLTPISKKNQFNVLATNIIILPMICSPTTVTVAHTGSQTFTGLGGYGTVSYALTTNNSGGSINSSTGVYTAGSTPSVTDVVTVTDSMGNTATATITVT